jgi:hypothetical protein
LVALGTQKECVRLSGEFFGFDQNCRSVARGDRNNRIDVRSFCASQGGAPCDAERESSSTAPQKIRPGSKFGRWSYVHKAVLESGGGERQS